MPKKDDKFRYLGKSAAVDAETESRAFDEEPADAAFVFREEPADGGKGPYDLLERTACFGEAIVRFAKRIPLSPVNDRLISQLVGAGTSVGANFCEADDAVSGKDFRNKIGTCKKESRETMYFLRMIAAAENDLKTDARKLWQEAKELNLIFGAIWRKGTK
jgi:four helix bundle protein